jgi:hypothetical protein
MALAVMKNSLGKWTPPSGVVPLALAMRRVAPATIEPESHLTLPPTWCVSYSGVEIIASIVVRVVVRVRSPMAQVDSRIHESERRHNGLSWFGSIDALRPAVDDLYTQEHPKSGGYNRV